MAKIKPKYGISNSGWVEKILSEAQEQELFKIVPDEDFVRAMEGIAFRNKSRRDYEKQAPNAAEIEASLKIISDEAATLKDHLHSLDRMTRMLLQDSTVKFRIAYGFIDDIQKELSTLNIISSNALLNMDRESFRKTIGSHLSLAAETEVLLNKHEVLTTGYIDGPWCKCIKIVLDACGETITETRNIVKAYLELKPTQK